MFQSSASGAYDVYVAKLNNAGSSLIYSTYIGGSGSLDYGLGLGVDDTGNAYITGVTDSTDFPTTPGSAQPVFGGGTERLPDKLNELIGVGAVVQLVLRWTRIRPRVRRRGSSDDRRGLGPGRAAAGYPTSGNAYAWDFIGGADGRFRFARRETTLADAASLPYSTSSVAPATIAATPVR